MHATAVEHGIPLVTKDERLRGYAYRIKRDCLVIRATHGAYHSGGTRKDADLGMLLMGVGDSRPKTVAPGYGGTQPGERVRACSRSCT